MGGGRGGRGDSLASFQSSAPTVETGSPASEWISPHRFQPRCASSHEGRGSPSMATAYLVIGMAAFALIVVVVWVSR